LQSRIGYLREGLIDGCKIESGTEFADGQEWADGKGKEGRVNNKGHRSRKELTNSLLDL